MISQNVFAEELTELADWFGVKKLTAKVSSTIYKFLGHALTDEEFTQACQWAICHQPVNYGMPTAAQLVESVHGTIQERAILQLDNLDRLSPVGRKAYEAIGGAWAKDHSDRPDLWRKDFITQYSAFAKKALLSDLVMPPVKIALEPAKVEADAPSHEVDQLKGDLARLNAVWKFGKDKRGAIAEAEELGLVLVRDDKDEITGFALPEENLIDVSSLLSQFGAWNPQKSPDFSRAVSSPTKQSVTV